MGYLLAFVLVARKYQYRQRDDLNLTILIAMLKSSYYAIDLCSPSIFCLLLSVPLCLLLVTIVLRRIVLKQEPHALLATAIINNKIIYRLTNHRVVLIS